MNSESSPPSPLPPRAAHGDDRGVQAPTPIIGCPRNRRAGGSRGDDGPHRTGRRAAAMPIAVEVDEDITIIIIVAITRASRRQRCCRCHCQSAPGPRGIFANDDACLRFTCPRGHRGLLIVRRSCCCSYSVIHLSTHRSRARAPLTSVQRFGFGFGACFFFWCMCVLNSISIRLHDPRSTCAPDPAIAHSLLELSHKVLLVDEDCLPSVGVDGRADLGADAGNRARLAGHFASCKGQRKQGV